MAAAGRQTAAVAGAALSCCARWPFAASRAQVPKMKTDALDGSAGLPAHPPLWRNSVHRGTSGAAVTPVTKHHMRAANQGI
jgi:hypothetical protein